MPRYIVAASVALTIGEEFEGEPRAVIFSPPKDHPALLELWHWYVDDLLAQAKADGARDLF